MMKKIIFVFILLPFIVSILFCRDTTESVSVMIADIELSNSLRGLSETKIEAAANLALRASEGFFLIPREVRDSVLSSLKAAGKAPTIINAASELNASRVLFIKINRLDNILRVDILSALNRDSLIKRSGKGYAALRLRSEKDSSILYDPALLAAFQRAFADAEDSSMFKNAEGILEVYPAKTIVIGSIYYKNEKGPGWWNVFKDKIAGSYEAVETIFSEAVKHENYVVYDIPTRDSLYALFKMYLIENYNPMSAAEIEALSRLDVDCFITGSLKGKGTTAELELSLYEYSDNDYHLIRSEKALLEEDSFQSYKALLRKITAKLLEGD